MASISQGLVLTTAMVVSSTVLYLAFSRPKTFSQFQFSGNSTSLQSNKQILRSCLSSEETKRERKKKKKKKKVKFADNVKESSGTTEELRRKQNRVSGICRNEIPEFRKMPANRVALYNGILRDRVHRMECSY